MPVCVPTSALHPLLPKALTREPAASSGQQRALDSLSQEHLSVAPSPPPAAAESASPPGALPGVSCPGSGWSTAGVT